MYNKVYVEISNICNMRCSFCHGHSRPPRTMSAQEFSVILDKLRGYTKYIYYHLMGEPLIHPQLPEFIKMAGQRGYRSILTTNGTLLPQRQVELLAAGVHKVNISLHSFEEGGPDAHRRYVSDLAAFAKAAAQVGTIVNFRLWNEGFDEGKNPVAMQILQENIPGDWVANSRGLRIRDKIFVEMGQRFQWPDIHEKIQGETVNCYGMRSHFGILADGTVVPCCLDSDGVINLGNIFRQELDQILNSPRALRLQHHKADEDLCRRCGYAQRFTR